MDFSFQFMNFKWKCNPMSHKEDAEEPPRPKKQRAAVVIPKTALDVQRIQLERLMEDPVSGPDRCHTVPG